MKKSIFEKQVWFDIKSLVLHAKKLIKIISKIGPMDNQLKNDHCHCVLLLFILQLSCKEELRFIKIRTAVSVQNSRLWYFSPGSWPWILSVFSVMGLSLWFIHASNTSNECLIGLGRGEFGVQVKVFGSLPSQVCFIYIATIQVKTHHMACRSSLDQTLLWSVLNYKWPNISQMTSTWQQWWGKTSLEKAETSEKTPTQVGRLPWPL